MDTIDRLKRLKDGINSRIMNFWDYASTSIILINKSCLRIRYFCGL